MELENGMVKSLCTHGEFMTLHCKEELMSEMVRSNENFQVQDATLKIFEEILKEKLDLIFKQRTVCHITPGTMDGFEPPILQKGIWPSEDM